MFMFKVGQGYPLNRVKYEVSRFWPLLLAVLIITITSAPNPEPVVAQSYPDIGYRDFDFGTGCVSAPTGEKPESKVWWNDGSWWGNLCHSDGFFHIYRLNLATQTWIDTGTIVDKRKSDVLWDGTKLYIVTHTFTTSSAEASCPSNCGRLFRYSYNAATKAYSLDAGFPVTVTGGKSETLVLAKDSTGQLWVTYVENRRVMVNRSVNGDAVWGTPFQLPTSATAGNITSDEISSIVSFGDSVGVMWSNQTSDKMYFAVHRDFDADNVWQPEEIALQGNNNSDDHINMQADSSGRVYAAVKTGSDPLNYLVVRQTNGQWSSHVFGTVADSHTRPILALDSSNNRLYYFATSGQSGGAIYYKTTPLNNIGFAPGRGDIFISHSGSIRINNATSNKLNSNATTGLLVVASDDDTYYHNYLSLSGTPSTPTFTPTVGPSPTASNTPTPSNTPTASNTPTPSNTPTATNTPGPEVTFTSAADALVKLSRPNNNYGTMTTMRVQLASSENMDSYLRFNVTGVGASVQRATLRLYVTDASPDGGSVYSVGNTFRGTSTPWTETGVNWNNAPEISGTPLGAFGSVALGAWVEMDVTSAVSGDGVYNFALSSSDTNSALYATREDAANAPMLVIETGAGSPTTPTDTPTDTPTPTPTDTPTEGPTPTPTDTATPTTTPTDTPTATPTTEPGPIVTFSAIADSQVKLSRPNNNYGTQSDLRVRLTSSENIDSYLKFEVSGVSDVVQRATLRLYVTDGGPDGGAVYAVDNNYRNVAAPWTETDINWNNAPTISGAPITTFGALDTGTWVEVDVTSVVGGNGFYSFALTSDDGNSILYNAREASANTPELVIETGDGAPLTVSSVLTSTETPTNTPTDTPTPSDTPTEGPTLTPSDTSTPTNTPADTPTATPTTEPGPIATFSPIADSQIKLSRPDNNYGSQSDLRIRLAGAENIDSYLKFEVTGVSDAVHRATLRLYVTDGGPDGGAIYGVGNTYRDSAEDWTETGITWNNAPQISGAPITTFGSLASSTWIEADVTSVVSGNGVYSFALSSENANSILYNARESGSHTPELVIETGTSELALESFASVARFSASTGDTDTLTSETDPTPDMLVPLAVPLAVVEPSPSSIEDVDAGDGDGQRIESDSSLVVRTAGWVASGYPAGASGSSYLISTTLEDTLTMSFSGTAVEVGYVKNQSFGAFVVEVDGQVMQVVSDSAEADFVFERKVRIDGLAQGAHTLRVLPQNSLIAIDFFVVFEDLVTDVSEPVVITATPSEQPAEHIVPTASATPTVASSVTETPQPVAGSPASGQHIESDSESVIRSAGWVANANPPGASGSSYLINTMPEDTLSLSFTGSTIEVGYVENQAFGGFAVEVDGVVMQVVNGSSEADFVFDQRVQISGLSDGTHVLRILPQNSVIAIDFFVVSAVSQPPDAPALEPDPTVTATSQETTAPTATDIAPVTGEPTETPPATLVAEPISVPPVTATFTSTPVALMLPWQGASASQFATVGLWRTDDGFTWQVTGDQSSVLSLQSPLDLRGSLAPILSFQSLTVANNTSTAVQISTDAQNWVLAAVLQADDEWQHVEVDLSAYRGQIVWLRWVWLPQAPVPADPLVDSWTLQQVMVHDPVPMSPEPTLTVTNEPPAVEATATFTESVVTPTEAVPETSTATPEALPTIVETPLATPTDEATIPPTAEPTVEPPVEPTLEPSPTPEPAPPATSVPESEPAVEDASTEEAGSD